MSSDSGDRPLDMMPWLEKWWEQSEHNPLYAWEALGHALAANKPPPPWVRDYFLEAASKMRSLSWGRDFRSEERKDITPDQAKDLVGEALGLWRPKSKNAFARRAADGVASKTALDVQYASGRKGERTVAYFKNGQEEEAPTPKSVAEKFQRGQNVDTDRAARKLRYGAGFNRPKSEG